MGDFDELFALEVAKRAIQQLMRIPEISHLQWSDATVETVSRVGASVAFGEPWGGAGKLVTADWLVDGSEQWLDFLLWLGPGERPNVEVVNYRERWAEIPAKIVMKHAVVSDRS
jgi:hypothetical protein